MEKTIYTIVGLLDEYSSREIAGCKTGVEWFYPAETAVANLFETYLRQLAAEHNLQTEITREVAKSGHIRFHSEEINDLICAFYIEKKLTDLGRRKLPKYKDNKSRLPYAGGRIDMTAFPPRTSPVRLTDEQHDTRLAFLTGAYARYGKDNRFQFANSYPKARVIETLLLDLGSPWVEFTSNIRGVPAVFEIEFEMTEEMKNCLVSYRWDNS